MEFLDNSSDLPLVSAIIPAYNAARFIEATLESILAQTYQNIEVIVVDDGSKDATPEIVRKFSDRDPRITLIQQANAGVAAARNRAIQSAKGEFVAPIDADDIWYPHKLEKQVQCFLEANSEVGLVYAWSAHIDEDRGLTGGFNAGNREGRVLLDLVYRDFVGNGSVPLMRRSCLEQIGGYNKNLRERGAQGCEDWDIALRMAELYEFRVVPEILVGYRQSFGSMSSLGTVMQKSYNLTVTTIKANHPEIPNIIYQWSKAEFYYYLAQGARQGGKQGRAFTCLLQSAQLDPKIILQRRSFYRSLVAIVLSLPFQAISDSLWSPKSWYEFRKKAPLKTQVQSLEEVTIKIKAEWDTWWSVYEDRLAKLKPNSSLVGNPQYRKSDA